jgi:hypothetical protein
MDREINISLRFERRWYLVALISIFLLLVISLVSQGWQQQGAAAANELADTLTMAQWPRLYYLTMSNYDGAAADGTDGNGAGVCASGYHFASFWELQDLSNSRYDIAHGVGRGDSHLGPPSGYLGWVRTGNDSSGDAVAGEANCSTWSEPGESFNGTAIQLPTDWSMGVSRIPWQAEARACSSDLPVWCLADYAGFRIYLPLLLKE